MTRHNLSTSEQVRLQEACDTVRAALVAHAAGTHGGSSDAKERITVDLNKKSEIHTLIRENKFDELFSNDTWLARLKDARNLDGIRPNWLTDDLATIDKYLLAHA